jgi:hypothetical protein
VHWLHSLCQVLNCPDTAVVRTKTARRWPWLFAELPLSQAFPSLWIWLIWFVNLPTSLEGRLKEASWLVFVQSLVIFLSLVLFVLPFRPLRLFLSLQYPIFFDTTRSCFSLSCFTILNKRIIFQAQRSNNGENKHLWIS